MLLWSSCIKEEVDKTSLPTQAIDILQSETREISVQDWLNFKNQSGVLPKKEEGEVFIINDVNNSLVTNADECDCVIEVLEMNVITTSSSIGILGEIRMPTDCQDVPCDDSFYSDFNSFCIPSTGNCNNPLDITNLPQSINFNCNISKSNSYPISFLALGIDECFDFSPIEFDYAELVFRVHCAGYYHYRRYSEPCEIPSEGPYAIIVYSSDELQIEIPYPGNDPDQTERLLYFTECGCKAALYEDF